MISGTIVKINRIVQEAPTTTSEKYSKMSSKDIIHSVVGKDTGWEFEKIKTLKFSSETEAYITFSKKIKDPRVANQRKDLGLLLHKSSLVENSKIIELLHEEETDCLTRVTIANPLWAGHGGVKRNIENRGFEAEVSSAMQSQLFAMLESSAGDDNWMNSFSLKDFQQKDMYKWQDSNLEVGNSMTPREMMRLMKNVINVAKLPWIGIEFKEQGDSCMFAITRSGGKTISISDKDDDSDDGGKWNWLNKANESKFEVMGEENEGYRIRISDMRLIMIMSWAMNSSILLHEIGHYITFIMPTKYKINKGAVNLNYKQYSNLFSGHGALYMAIFSRLLVDFAYMKEEPLYESIKEAGLAWFPIKSLNVKDVDEGIERYLSHIK